ncbi:hypothetical protein H310_13372 [Aphanomyces invadans]|uniref:Uncharacterized protein n=1 Tax=Aphanomyces invadans TaxID=157072 RepID=A0A024TE40_9STRA|nr:hypothetical protein H310_13372 [Aphanomyces invadans]ETV92318.1 hypothetical protein H310_13372 [Aphanomyces invadans]|eukprot:XP_008879069.1 hypothetical protein H310_13372 [Aphanomyces invadans]
MRIPYVAEICEIWRVEATEKHTLTASVLSWEHARMGQATDSICVAGYSRWCYPV